MGNYYNFDIPSALHNSFKSYFFDLSSDEFEFYFGLILSITTFSSIISPIFMGGK